MRLTSQNLTDGEKPLWVFGRARLIKSGPNYREAAHFEWALGRRVKSFALKIYFGHGEYEDGIMFHASFPWLFSIFIAIDGIFRCKECYTGVAIHSNAFWLYPLNWAMELNFSDPWYRRCYAWDFPWALDWYSTEILELHTRELAQPVWLERKGDRKRLGIDNFKMMDSQRQAAADVTAVYPYTYVRKNGEVQERKAAVHVQRRTWRARWWPLIPIKRVSTCIDVAFNEEIGEGVDSWKGGTVGCGYEMRRDETPWECLRRMEAERRFER